MKHRCLAIFIVFVLFFTILGFIIFAETRMILTAKFVGNFLNQSQIYNNIGRIGQEIANATGDDNSKTLVLAVTQNIDPNWIKSVVNTNLSPLFDYFWNRTSKLNVVIDTTPFKNKLPANFASQIEELLRTMPQCPEGPPTNMDENAPPCLSAAARTNLQALAQMPNSINLADYVKNPDNSLGRTKASFTFIRFGFWFELILSIILMGILVLLGRGWWPSIPRWIGLALVLPSGVAILGDLLWKVSVSALQTQYLPTLSTTIRPIVAPIIAAFNAQTLLAGLILAGSLFFAGWIMIILSYALPHPPEPKPVAKPVVAPPVPPKATPPSSGGLTEAK